MLQIVALARYLTAIRSHFKPKGDELIPRSMRRYYRPLVTSALHLRGSVILNWLKIHPKRQVQYMAGHKYISSTERYASQGVEDLQDALAKHHPFG